MNAILASIASIAIAGAAHAAVSGVSISEIRVNELGFDTQEYFELVGPPGYALDGLTYVVIGDGIIINSGIVEFALPLDGQVIPADGHFLVAEDTFLLAAPDFVAPLNFENFDNVTHLLVADFTGGEGDDLDTNNDGTLDATPWSAVLSAVGLLQEPLPPFLTEWAYGAALGFEDVGPDHFVQPYHVYRCVPDGTWTIGHAAILFGNDTPGEPNAECEYAGACCVTDIVARDFCVELTESHCAAIGGMFLGEGTVCDGDDCPTHGACCVSFFPPCMDTTAEYCASIGGIFQGPGTLCADGICEVRTGACCLTDCGEPTGVACVETTADECAADGGSYLGDGVLCEWNPCIPPCDLPGRPAVDGSNDRVLRGFIVGWAVNAEGQEIRHNHLAGNATTINYRDGAAREANAWSFPTAPNTVDEGQPTGTPGVLNLDGVEYVAAYNGLLLQFKAEGSSIYTGPGAMLTTSSELTLHPVSLDFTDGGQPVVTKADFEVWNENELKLSGAYRCVTCWDQTLLSQYGVPNHFLLPTLQTNVGMARIAGTQSAQCPGSTDEAILGQLVEHVAFDGDPRDATAFNLVGTGSQSATIRYPVELPPDEAPAGSATTRVDFATSAARTTGVRGRDAGTPETFSPPALVPDRTTATEKGSIVFFSSVEVRWDCAGDVIQDTFVQVTNDSPSAVRVQFYFVNGDAPFTDEECGENHPGWNFVDNAITLTGNQTISWSVLTGQPYGLSPFTVLDP